MGWFKPDKKKVSLHQWFICKTVGVMNFWSFKKFENFINGKTFFPENNKKKKHIECTA